MTSLQFNLQLPPADPGNARFRFIPLIVALECLTKINQWHFKRGDVPPLFSSGVVYQEEPPGREDWDDAIVVSRRGWGDCEDLAAYLCAELRELHGIDAECVIKWKFIGSAKMRRAGYPDRLIPPDGIYLIHVMVQLPDGRIIDPSKLLGMEGEYR